jgi:2-oxoglutarate dehydrogenase E1 component
MLRLKAAASPVTDFTSGSFRPLIGSAQESDAGVRRVVLCSGKVYYDLAARRRALLADTGHATDTAIVRVERLYPLPVSELAAELARYPGAETIIWVQEEPANMGGWPTMALKLPRVLNHEVGVVSLPASSAPASGSAKLHAATHREIIETAIPPRS